MSKKLPGVLGALQRTEHLDFTRQPCRSHETTLDRPVDRRDGGCRSSLRRGRHLPQSRPAHRLRYKVLRVSESAKVDESAVVAAGDELARGMESEHLPVS